MAATPLLGGKFFDYRVVGLSPGGALYTYAAGTLTPLATYTDAGAGSPNNNPVICNAFGQADVYLGSSAYRFRLYTDLIGNGGTLLWDEDNITATSGLVAQLAASSGSSLVGFIQAGTGAIAHLVQDKLRERVSILDFGADPTGAADSTAAFNAFVTYITANATRVRGIFPNGIYQYSASPNFAIQNADFAAEGEVHLRYTGSANALTFDAGSGSQNISNVKFRGNFIVEALSSAGHGIYVRGVHRSIIEARVRGCGSASAGLRIEFSVCTEFRVRVSGPTEDSWYSASAPLNGYYITRRGVGENTSACLFYPIVENLAGNGITVDYAWQNQFFAGTSENGAGIGVVCTANSQRNAFYGIDVENNVSALSDAGLGNRFYSILAGSPGAGVTFTGNLSTHINGFYDAITDNGGGTILDGIVYSNNGGAITGTAVGQTKRSVYNITTLKFDADRTALSLVASVSVLNNTATTVLTLPSSGNMYYQVGAYLPGVGAAATYGAYALIYQDGNTARILSQVNGASLTITLAGQAVQVTQTSGVTQTVAAFAKSI